MSDPEQRGSKRNYGLGEAVGEDPWMTVHRLQGELSAAEARIAELERVLRNLLTAEQRYATELEADGQTLAGDLSRAIDEADAALHPKEDTDAD